MSVATRPQYPNADLWRTFRRLTADQGGMDVDFTISWTLGHDDGPSVPALGNRWADCMAKLGAATHALPEADVQTATSLRRNLISTLQWMGRAVALHMRPFLLPT